MAAGYKDYLRWIWSWLSGTTAEVEPDPVRRFRLVGRDDTALRLTGDGTSALPLVGQASNSFRLRGGDENMPVTAPIECYRGEAVEIAWHERTHADITNYTLVLRLLDEDAGTVLVSRTEGSGITVTDADEGEATMTFTSTHTDRAAGDYFYTIWRTDSGSETLLTRGKFTIRDSETASP